MEGEINKLKILDELSEKLANTRIYHDFFKNLQVKLKAPDEI